MTVEKFVGGVTAAVLALLFAEPVVSSLLPTATLDSTTQTLLSRFFSLALSPFGVISGLIGWVALSRRNAW